MPKAIKSLGDPLIRIFRRKSAHSRLRSFARNPSHVSPSAVSRRSGVPSWPSETRNPPRCDGGAPGERAQARLARPYNSRQPGSIRTAA